MQQGPPVGLAQSESTPQRPVPGPAPRPADASAHEAAPKPGPQRGRSPRRRRAPRDAGDHGLRDIVGAGPSQLGVSGALRGRDVNRPTEADIAEAEQDLVIVRRNWQPPDHR